MQSKKKELHVYFSISPFVIPWKRLSKRLDSVLWATLFLTQKKKEAARLQKPTHKKIIIEPCGTSLVPFRSSKTNKKFFFFWKVCIHWIDFIISFGGCSSTMFQPIDNKSKDYSMTGTINHNWQRTTPSQSFSCYTFYVFLHRSKRT